MFGNKMLTLTGLTLTVAGTLTGIANTTASAADKLVVDASEGVATLTSQVVAVGLPRNAQRDSGSIDLARYNAVMQKVARDNHGTLSQTEVLRWTGNAASTAKNTLTCRMKQSGYKFAYVDAFDTSEGHVTPVAAVRGSKSDSIIGLWVEMPGQQTLLIWGRFRLGVARKTAPVAQTNSNAAQRAKAYQAYKDYQYATMLGPHAASCSYGTGW